VFSLTDSILIVSEDPEFVVRAQESLQSDGLRVVGCLGPAHTECVLDVAAICPLAFIYSIALIDSPPSGVFGHHWKQIPVGAYAERLQRAHPEMFVVLTGAPESFSGAQGEVAHTQDRALGLQLVRQLARTESRPIPTT
jgi:hypothetical protein